MSKTMLKLAVGGAIDNCHPAAADHILHAVAVAEPSGKAAVHGE